MTSATRVSSFAGALESLTRIKIRELAHRRAVYDRESANLIADLESHSSYREKFNVLIDTIERGDFHGYSGPSMGLENSRFLVIQGLWDSSLSDEFYKEKLDAAMKDIAQGETRTRYAQLFGAVIQEWMDAEGADSQEGTSSDERPEKAKQREILEGYMWDNAGVQSDVAQFREMLEDVFGEPKEEDVDVVMAEAEGMGGNEEEEGKEYDDIIAGFEGRKTSHDLRVEAEKKLARKKKLADFIERVRKSMRKFSESPLFSTVTKQGVEKAIDACLSYDSLSAEQQAAAREIRQSSILMKEIASVLTLTIRDLRSWEWPEEGVQLYMRRHLNGKYRCFFEQDIITIIFLQYIGMSFGSRLKMNLVQVVENGWDWGVPCLSKAELARRREMIRSESSDSRSSEISDDSIVGQRIKDMKENYITSALPDTTHVSAYGDDTKDGAITRVTKLKQGVLRRLLADIQYTHHTSPDKTVTVATADARNFAPSLPHDIALEAMRFFGVPENWLKFFAKVISPPAKFTDQTILRNIRRGTPTSQALGYTMGEAAFFCLDVAVNQSAPGLKWCRQHDDIWFWDQDEEKVNRTWKIMQRFAKICGFSWNEQKSGSCKILSKNDIANGNIGANHQLPGSATLPQDHVKWGLLVLDSSGKFSINQEMVQWHTQELKERFKKPHSTLQYIRAYSRYMNFFTRNCAQTAVVFSQQHVENLLTTLKSIHQTLFPDHSNSFFQFISAVLRSRFPHILPHPVDTTPIPESWLILPLVHGGLGCPTPMLETFAYLCAFQGANMETTTGLRSWGDSDTDFASSRGTFAACLAADRTLYATAKRKWEDRSSYPSNTAIFPLDYATKKPQFMSFEEYNRGRETMAVYWGNTYNHMLSVALPAKACQFREHWRVDRWLSQFPEVDGSPFSQKSESYLGTREADELECPWDWWFAIYAEQQERVFGKLTVLDEVTGLGAMVAEIQEKAVKFDL